MNTESIHHHGHALAISHIREAINHYPDLSTPKLDVLNKWRKKVKALEEAESLPYDYLLPMTIGLPTGIFSYQLDPVKLLTYIKEEEILPIQLDTDMLLSHIERDELESGIEDDDYPIIMLETPLLPRGFLLTGKYSIVNAKKTKKKKVDVIILTEMEYLSLMHDKISKAMYMFHRDLQNLLSTPMSLSLQTLYLSKADMILK